MTEHPDGHQHYDIDGNPVSLHKLCRTQPEWARNQILDARRRIAELEAENERLKERNKQLEHWFHGYRTPEESMAALVAENEELKAAKEAWLDGTWKAGKKKGMERAAEIVENHEEPNLRGYVRDSLIQAIRDRIKENSPNTPTQGEPVE